MLSPERKYSTCVHTCMPTFESSLSVYASPHLRVSSIATVLQIARKYITVYCSNASTCAVISYFVRRSNVREYYVMLYSIFIVFIILLLLYHIMLCFNISRVIANSRVLVVPLTNIPMNEIKWSLRSCRLDIACISKMGSFSLVYISAILFNASSNRHLSVCTRKTDPLVITWCRSCTPTGGTMPRDNTMSFPLQPCFPPGSLPFYSFSGVLATRSQQWTG